MQNATTKPENGIRRKFRLSIFQLTLLATGVAAFLAWSLQDRSRELVWLDSTLKYEAPPVPENFRNTTNQQPLPAGAIPFYKNGTDLFQKEHLNGWKACRYHFYKDYDLANDKIVFQKDLNDIDVTLDLRGTAKILAYNTGYKDCQDQIHELLLTQPKQELKRGLARKKADSLPVLLIAIVCLLLFLISLTFPKRNHALAG